MWKKKLILKIHLSIILHDLDVGLLWVFVHPDVSQQHILLNRQMPSFIILFLFFLGTSWYVKPGRRSP